MHLEFEPDLGIQLFVEKYPEIIADLEDMNAGAPDSWYKTLLVEKLYPYSADWAERQFLLLQSEELAPNLHDIVNEARCLADEGMDDI